jgi:hypothetical protein
MRLYNLEELASILTNSNAYIVYFQKYNCANGKNGKSTKKKKDDDARKEDRTRL